MNLYFANKAAGKEFDIFNFRFSGLYIKIKILPGGKIPDFFPNSGFFVFIPYSCILTHSLGL
jgi:hypothetical protein